MQRMGAAKFKEQCLALLDSLDQDGLIITKHGRPVARIIPFSRTHASLIGSLRGRIRVKGSLFSTNVHWDADGKS